MASRRRDDGQLLLLAGVLIVLAYILYSTQASLVATLGQEAGREASNPVVADYTGLRATLLVTLTREQTEAGVLTFPAVSEEAAYKARAESLLTNLADVMARRGFLFHGEVLDVDFGTPSRSEYEMQLYLSNGQTTVVETPTFIIVP